jgi:hypothetical protein
MKPKLFLVLCLCLCGMISAQTLEITPTSVMIDEAAAIRASGLEPNERVSIRAELVDGADESWASQADFVADAHGNVDLSKQAPVKGSYSDVSAMGSGLVPEASHFGKRGESRR